MIQVLNRAFDILAYLAQEPERAKPLGEIADSLGLNHGTCANILKTMVRRDYVEQVGTRKGYVLGPMPYWTVRHGPYRRDLVVVAAPVMEEASAKMNESLLLATLHQRKRFLLHKVVAHQDIRVSDDVFYRDDVYGTATGRVLLSGMSREELEVFIAQEGLPTGSAWAGFVTKPRMIEELAKIRRDGVTTETTRRGVVQIGAAVVEEDRIVAALGCFLPAARFTGGHRKIVMSELRNAAERIGSTLSIRYASGEK